MRWLLTSWGSSGDLHPFLALGRGLIARGHEVTLVGHPEWTADTARAGLRFVPTDEPPREDFLRDHPEIMSPRWGGLVSLRALVRLAIEPSFEPTLAALRAEAPAHDVIVAQHFVFPAAVAAEITGRPWATVSLAPGVIPSAYTRPGTQSGSAGEGIFSQLVNRLIWAGGRRAAASAIDGPVNRLRARHGLAPVRDAMFGALSPRLNLQLYSELFAPRPPDWPARIRYGGFCFYDPPDAALPPEAEAFLAAGEPPILFTLGSAVMHQPGNFYADAVCAVSALDRRGLLLIGREENRPALLPRNIFALPYAPYSLVMPRACAVVHQAGIGTLSHALRAGLPSVAVPFAFDQPNNASRLAALGLAEVLPRSRRNARELEQALRRLLNGSAPEQARAFGEKLRTEDGLATSCAILEETFAP